MIGIFQGSPKGRANECQRRAKGGHGRATSKKQGKRRAWEGALPKTGQFGSYAPRALMALIFLHSPYLVPKS